MNPLFTYALLMAGIFLSLLAVVGGVTRLHVLLLTISGFSLACLLPLKQLRISFLDHPPHSRGQIPRSLPQSMGKRITPTFPRFVFAHSAALRDANSLNPALANHSRHTFLTSKLFTAQLKQSEATMALL